MFMTRSLALILSALALASCSRGGDEMEFIDFATQHGQRFVHGTLSSVHGAPAATWTIHDNGTNDTYDTPLSADEFHDLWREAHQGNEMERFIVADDGTRLSFTDHYVMNMTSIKGSDTGSHTYMIPQVGAPPAIDRLMHRIEGLSAKH